MESHQRDHENYVACSRNRRRRAKALLDFERHDDDELGFRKNDIITVCQPMRQGPGQAHADPACLGCCTASSAGKEGRRSAQSSVRSPREAAGVSEGCLGMRQYVPMSVALGFVLSATRKSLSWLPHS